MSIVSKTLNKEKWVQPQNQKAGIHANLSTIQQRLLSSTKTPGKGT